MEKKDKQQVSFFIDRELYAAYKKKLIDLRTNTTYDLIRHIFRTVHHDESVVTEEKTEGKLLIDPERFCKSEDAPWPARFKVSRRSESARYIEIQSRSSIVLVVTKLEGEYFISAPDFNVVIPPISSLANNAYWITEKMVSRDMPTPDAITAAQVLDHIGDF